MMVRNNLTAAVVCNQCQERMVLAHGYNSFALTPELAGQRFGCLGWRVTKRRALCPACSGLPVLTCRQVLTDFMNYMERRAAKELQREEKQRLVFQRRLMLEKPVVSRLNNGLKIVEDFSFLLPNRQASLT